MAKGPSPSALKKHSNTTVKYGSKGDPVKCLQEALNANGAKLDVDGQFGKGTKKAVSDFQKKKKLGVDGIVGPNTWGALAGKKPPKDQGGEESGGKGSKASKSGKSGKPSKDSCVIKLRLTAPNTNGRGMHPVKNAEVKIPGVKDKFRTNNKGEVTLTVPAGKHKVDIEAGEHESLRANKITARGGSTINVHYEMRPKS